MNNISLIGCLALSGTKRLYLANVIQISNYLSQPVNKTLIKMRPNYLRFMLEPTQFK